MSHNILDAASRRWIFGAGAAALLAAVSPSLSDAQEPQGKPADKKPYNTPWMFTSDTVISFTLHAPFGKLRRDRQEETEYRVAHITFPDSLGTARVPVRVRTRGVWRKENCQIPPLMLNFAKDSTRGTLFGHMDRVRFSSYCRNTDDHEQYVLQEHQIYRVQKLLTPFTFAVRLARVTFIDSESNDTVSTRYGFLQEIDEEFAERVGVRLVDQQGAGPGDLEPYESALFGVFQYFVANSDFSIRALHNVVLVYRDPYHVPVARDFDWSGAVNARYAKPNPVLRIRHIAQRIMRGYCAPAEDFEKVFQLFRDRKDAIYALYSDPLNAAMKPDVVKNTLEYFDKFYEIINDPKRSKREIVEACLGDSAN